jgi:hypothetical protein
MDETRAIARLPHLDIEIRHRRLPEGQSEQLAISLRATPLFEAFAQFLERQAPWPWLTLQPWLWLGQMIQASWQPWLSARAVGVAAAQRTPRAEGHEPTQGADVAAASAVVPDRPLAPQALSRP